MGSTPKPQEIYRHFKGNLYQIITVAEHSETGESLVIYQALYGTYKIYARPLDSFMEKVDRVKYPNVAQEYRFECINMESAEDVVDKSTLTLGCGGQESRCTITADEECAAVEQEAMVEQENTSMEQESVSVEQDSTLVERESTSVEQDSFLTECEQITSEYEAEPTLDPLVWDFLDADSHEARLNILAALHHRITDDMITTMAVACDIEVPDGDLEERYSQLKSCLQMLDRFEIRRN